MYQTEVGPYHQRCSGEEKVYLADQSRGNPAETAARTVGSEGPPLMKMQTFKNEKRPAPCSGNLDSSTNTAYSSGSRHATWRPTAQSTPHFTHMRTPGYNPQCSTSAQIGKDQRAPLYRPALMSSPVNANISDYRAKKKNATSKRRSEPVKPLVYINDHTTEFRDRSYSLTAIPKIADNTAIDGKKNFYNSLNSRVFIDEKFPDVTRSLLTNHGAVNPQRTTTTTGIDKALLYQEFTAAENVPLPYINSYHNTVNMDKNNDVKHGSGIPGEIFVDGPTTHAEDDDDDAGTPQISASACATTPSYINVPHGDGPESHSYTDQFSRCNSSYDSSARAGVNLTRLNVSTDTNIDVDDNNEMPATNVEPFKCRLSSVRMKSILKNFPQMTLSNTHIDSYSTDASKANINCSDLSQASPIPGELFVDGPQITLRNRCNASDGNYRDASPLSSIPGELFIDGPQVTSGDRCNASGHQSHSYRAKTRGDNTTAQVSNNSTTDMKRKLEELESMYKDLLSMLNVYDTDSSEGLHSNTGAAKDKLNRPSAHKKAKMYYRLKTLEKHMSSVAGRVSKLRSEIQSQQNVMQIIQDIRRDINDLQRMNSRHMQNPEWKRFSDVVAGLTNSKTVSKLRNFFGTEPPLLAIFLKKLGYGHYIENFENESITIRELPYLNEQRMEKLGIPMGPRIRIIQEVQMCLRQQEFKIYIV